MVDRVTLTIEEWADVVGNLKGSAAALDFKSRSPHAADPDKLKRDAARYSAIADKIADQLS